MSTLIKILETKLIPINKVSIGKYQVRTQNVDKNLEPLKNSMKKFGQLTAITVYEKDGGYEVLTGQRRLNSAIELGWSQVRADIIEKPRDDMIAKAISFIENEIRDKMVNRDIINACNEFYNKYGTIKDVVEELALPYDLVASAVKLPRCPQVVKDAVNNGDVDLQVAIKATNALKWDRGSDEDAKKVLELAKKMQDEKMSRDMQKAVIEVGQADPSQNVNQIVQKAKQQKMEKITIALGHQETERLAKFANEETEGDKEEAAAALILDGLTDRGF